MKGERGIRNLEDERPARAIAVALRTPGQSRHDVEDHLEELTALARSAGIEVTDRVIQTRFRPSPATWIGRGKAEELAQGAGEGDEPECFLFDDELAPAQIRNLERITGRRVLTRTELILDIFARKARSHEAKLQVELARLEYQRTHLRHLWSHLEGQRGGIG
ncbi:MAG: GTPase HflX, partial [Candidatus Hydrogenedentota bacterium]